MNNKEPNRRKRVSRKETLFWNKVEGRTELVSCVRKVKRSKAEAITYAKKHNLYWYKCKYCGKYHVTKTPNNIGTDREIWKIIEPLIEAIRKGGQ